MKKSKTNWPPAKKSSSESESSSSGNPGPHIVEIPSTVKQITLARLLELKSLLGRSMPGRRREALQIELQNLRRQVRRALAKGATVEPGPFEAWLEPSNSFTRLRVE